jgi:hypothetical protein
MTREQELRMRGITEADLAKEHPTSWESFRINAAHQRKATAYWALQRVRQEYESNLKLALEPKPDGTVVSTKVKKAEKEYSFTNAQLKIAMSAQERSK